MKDARNAPLAKYFISPDNLHGNVPFIPIPLDFVAATMAVILREDFISSIAAVILGSRSLDSRNKACSLQPAADEREKPQRVSVH